MRVLIVAEADPARPSSGAERVLCEQARALQRRGHAVTVISGAATAAVRGAGFDVEPVGWSTATPWRVRRAARRLARAAPDLVVLHHPYPGALLARARWLRAVPIVLVYLSPWHEEFVGRAPRGAGLRRAMGSVLRRGLERLAVRRADRVYPMSRFMAERLQALHGVAPSRVRVVPGGVDRARFLPPADRGALRARLGIPPSTRLLLTLRNLEPRMGLPELLRAMPAVRAARGDVRLIVGGAGPLAASLEAEVRALALDETVRFEGFVHERDLPDLYGAADLFVLPSQALEGFGLVTLESLACGTPVLGTPVGATPELLAPLDRDLVLQDATPAAMADGILRVLARDAGAALRARCRDYTAAYTWDAAAAALEADVATLAAR